MTDIIYYAIYPPYFILFLSTSPIDKSTNPNFFARSYDCVPLPEPGPPITNITLMADGYIRYSY
jgi:hypothetical protein